MNAPPEVLVPMVLPERSTAKARVMLPIGRLKANFSLHQAQEKLNRIVQSLTELSPEIPREIAPSVYRIFNTVCSRICDFVCSSCSELQASSS